MVDALKTHEKAQEILVNALNGSLHGGDTAAVPTKTVSICETQPVTAEGLRALMAGCSDLEFGESTDSLTAALDGRMPCAVLLVDKAFGIQSILEWLSEASEAAAADPSKPHPAVVIWGVSITEAEALRFLQAGAHGILRKTANLASVVACLRSVAAGRSWMEDCVFRDQSRVDRYPRSELTTREQQVLELVERGCKNKEIAQELGIRPGTVKIHLKHIFEKTGVRGRYGLALNGWRDRAPVSIPA
ncbi:MAG TPA: response regulator transcription factor [Bryobacteraceae bacterium]|nr:response regulator transcription factor [Bryobacteraceae bacterium]